MNGLLGLIIVIATLVIVVAVGGALITDRLAANAESQARIAEARAQAQIEQTRLHEAGTTERMQSFYAILAALTSRPDDRLFLVLILLILPLDIGLVLYVLVRLKRRA